MLASPDASYVFGSLDTIILDELHALAPSKRGDLLSLGLARLHHLSGPDDHRPVRHSRPPERAAQLPAAADDAGRQAHDGRPRGGRRWREPPSLTSWRSRSLCHGAATRPASPCTRSTAPSPRHRATLVFVNTRMQAELVFQELWDLNEDSLPIALHHGSLDKTRRQKVEQAMTGRPPARRCRHVHPRSWRRLGRRGSRRQRRRAERGIAA